MKKINVPLYRRMVHLHYNVQSFNAELAEQQPECRPCKHQTGRCVETETKSLILIGWFDGRLDTLVHELAHAAFMILDTAGVRVSTTDDEAFCYLLAHLCRCFLPGLEAHETAQ